MNLLQKARSYKIPKVSKKVIVSESDIEVVNLFLSHVNNEISMLQMNYALGKRMSTSTTCCYDIFKALRNSLRAGAIEIRFKK